MSFEIDIKNQYDLPEGKKYSTCPLCSASRKKSKDKCLMIDWEKALATCQHCGEVIQIHTYKRQKETNYEKPKKELNIKLSKRIIEYFESRKISKETLLKMKISEGVEWMPGVEKEVNTIQFPYFNHSKLINIKYRDAKKNFKLHKGAEKILYNIDGIFKRDECIICEGEFDALSFIEIGYNNTVSVPNGASTNCEYLDDYIKDYFDDKEKIYIAVDNDEKGNELKQELIRRLGAEKCFIIDFKECKDANEYLVKFTPEKLKKTIDDGKELPLENIKTIEDEFDSLKNFYKNGFEKGFTIGLAPFDECFSTYLGQFITVTGIPSHGKSDFVDMMVTGYNKKYKWKCMYASPENEPLFVHIDKIIRKTIGKKPNLQYTESQEYKETHKHINDNYFFMQAKDGFDLKSVLNKGAEMVRRKGIKVLVIDPYNKVRLKESKNKWGSPDYTSEYLYEIEKFCRKYNVLTILVAHPRKPSGEFAKSYEPTFYDIKGGGEFYDMSPHGILVHRNFEENNVKIKILKCKFAHLGENQAECILSWNKMNGRYTCIDENNIAIHDDSNWLSHKQTEINYSPDKFIEPDNSMFKNIHSELIDPPF